MRVLTPEYVAERLEALRTTSRCGRQWQTEPWDSPAGLIDMVQTARPESVLELGADEGVSTEVFCLHAKHVTTIEPWVRLPWKQDHFIARNNGYPGLRVIKGFSPVALRELSDASFDLVYIDAVHEYDAIIDDVYDTFRLVRPGGWISGHDYVVGFNELDTIPAVNNLFGAGNFQVFSDGSWLTRRPDSLPPRESLPPAPFKEIGYAGRDPSIPAPTDILWEKEQEKLRAEQRKKNPMRPRFQQQIHQFARRSRPSGGGGMKA